MRRLSLMRRGHQETHSDGSVRCEAVKAHLRFAAAPDRSHTPANGRRGLAAPATFHNFRTAKKRHCAASATKLDEELYKVCTYEASSCKWAHFWHANTNSRQLFHVNWWFIPSISHTFIWLAMLLFNLLVPQMHHTQKEAAKRMNKRKTVETIWELLSSVCKMCISWLIRYLWWNISSVLWIKLKKKHENCDITTCVSWYGKSKLT